MAPVLKEVQKLVGGDRGRIELANAIEEVKRLTQESDARQAIHDRASRLVDTALARLNTAKDGSARAQEDAASRLVEALSSGASITPSPPTPSLRLEILAAEDALSNAISALETIQKTVLFDVSLTEAQGHLRRCAARIMAEPIDRIIHEATELNEALFAKRLALRAIMGALEYASPDHGRINSYLSAPIFPLQINYDAMEFHPITQNWRFAYQELMRDADVELPR